MDKSLSHFEMTESTENGSGESDNIEILNYGDEDSSSSNKSEGVELSKDALSVHEDFDNNLPETVTLLKYEPTGAKVYLVGTAHFSRESQEDVKKVIRNVQPHIVVLELCASRTNILDLDEETILEEAKNIDSRKIIQTIRQNGVYNGLMYLLLLNMSVYITKELGMAPGGEFRAAYREVLKINNCGIHLGDRPINITLQRALAKLTWFQTFKLAWHLLTSKDNISIEEIEKCKNRDLLEQLLADMAGEYPAFGEVFVDERDVYLTNSLQMAASSKLKPKGGYAGPGNNDDPLRVVGVVGIGHCPGIKKLWNQSQEPYVKAIMTVPAPGLTSKVVKMSFKVSLLAFGGFLVYKYVAVPRIVKDNAQLACQKLVQSLKFAQN